MITWLFGVDAKCINGNIYEINVAGYGAADVGPYSELKRFVGKKSGLDCHHIVVVEHLDLFRSVLSKEDAPCIAIPRSLHQGLISPRFTAEMNVFGGRKGGTTQGISKKEIMELYKQVYTWHTPYSELYMISANVLNYICP